MGSEFYLRMGIKAESKSLKLMNINYPGGTLYLLAISGQFIQSLAVLMNSREHGRSLDYFPPEMSKYFLYFFPRQRRGIFLFHYLSFAIQSGGSNSENHFALINLI
jgi:hypothetical protein